MPSCLLLKTRDKKIFEFFDATERARKMKATRVEAPPNTSTPFTVDTVLRYKGQEFSFGFTQRCPATRLYDTAGKGLGVRVTRVEHRRSYTSKPELIPNDPKVWVLEDCGVGPGSILDIHGEEDDSVAVSAADMNMVQMKLRYHDPESASTSTSYIVRKGTTMGKLRRSILVQFRSIEPLLRLLPEDALEIYYKGQQLTDPDQVPDYEEGETIEWKIQSTKSTSGKK